MRRLFLLCLIPLAVATQTQTPQGVDDSATVEGRVLNAANSEPLPKATVTLTWAFPAAGDSIPYTTTSDANGKFVLKGIVPGRRYRLIGNKPGFVGATYGARHPGGDGTLITFAAHEQLKDLSLLLIRQGTITGRMIDADGQPAQDALVQLLKYRYVQAKSGASRQLSTVTTATVDDLGDFRLWGVTPGKYMLAVEYRSNSPLPVLDRSKVPQPPESYVRTYYPGTADFAAAREVEVTQGGTVRGIGLTVLKVRTYHISGKVARGAATGLIQVNLVPRSAPGALFAGLPRFLIADAKGNFDISGIVPGAYFVRASVSDTQGPETGRAAVDVTSDNVEGVVIQLGPPIEVAGRIRMEDGSPTVSGIRLTAASRDDTVAASDAPKPDGSVKLSFPWPGIYDIRGTGLPQGGYVKSVRAGETDVLNSGLTVTGGTMPRVEVVVSPHAGALTGTVESAETGKPLENATVVLIPQEKARRDQASYYRSMATDQHGAFAFRILIPGEYKVYAWEDIENGAYLDPAFVKPVEAKGQTVKVEEDAHPEIKLKAIPADPAGAGQ